MIRYTTPTIILCVPIDITDSDKVVATFAQWNVRVDKEIGAENIFPHIVPALAHARELVK